MIRAAIAAAIITSVIIATVVVSWIARNIPLAILMLGMLVIDSKITLWVHKKLVHRRVNRIIGKSRP